MDSTVTIPGHSDQWNFAFDSILPAIRLQFGSNLTIAGSDLSMGQRMRVLFLDEAQLWDATFTDEQDGQPDP